MLLISWWLSTSTWTKPTTTTPTTTFIFQSNFLPLSMHTETSVTTCIWRLEIKVSTSGFSLLWNFHDIRNQLSLDPSCVSRPTHARSFKFIGCFESIAGQRLINFDEQPATGKHIPQSEFPHFDGIIDNLRIFHSWFIVFYVNFSWPRHLKQSSLNVIISNFVTTMKVIFISNAVHHYF